MHLVEIRENLQDSNFSNDIYEISRLINKITIQTELQVDLHYADLEYITTLATKTKTLLNKIYSILNLSKGGAENDNTK